mmetsp:Transcript_17200/g.28840  ORF Transcript_17200/g.28840 Transcript_17200/m.28840 type:complete len:270 (+) Transcript_17200:111-920(+)
MGASTSSVIRKHKEVLRENVLAKIEDAPEIFDDDGNQEKRDEIVDFIADSFVGKPGTTETIDPLFLWLVDEEGLRTEERNRRLSELTLYGMRFVNYPLFTRGMILTIRDSEGLLGVAMLGLPGIQTCPTSMFLSLVMKLGSPPWEKWSGSKDAAKRMQSVEVLDKLKKMFAEQYGGFWYLQTLATHQRARGKGYGGKLLNTIASIADYTRKAVYLETESSRHEVFYNRYGYKTIAKPDMVVKNPSVPQRAMNMWLMLREPQPVTMDPMP